MSTTSTPQYSTSQIGGSGGYGGGGVGATGGAGGFTGIFDDEVTIIEGGAYNELGYHHQPDCLLLTQMRGPGFADTVSPTNASEACFNRRCWCCR